MSWSAPAVGERNEIVMSASATRTRRTTTARRMSALRAFEGYGAGFERWTDEASTAARALRLGGATATGYRGRPSTELIGLRLLLVAVAAVAGAGLVAAVDGLELLEAPARAHRDARERALGEVHRHLGLVAKALVEPRQERAAAGEHDPAVHDVSRELRRRLVERRLDRLDDLRDGLVERAPHLLRREDDRLRQAREHVAAANL